MVGHHDLLAVAPSVGSGVELPVRHSGRLEFPASAVDQLIPVHDDQQPLAVTADAFGDAGHDHGFSAAGGGHGQDRLSPTAQDRPDVLQQAFLKVVESDAHSLLPAKRAYTKVTFVTPAAKRAHEKPSVPANSDAG